MTTTTLVDSVQRTAMQRMLGLFPLLALFALMLASVLAPLVAHAAAPAGLQIGNQASATYTDGTAITRTVTSNTVFTTVQQVASLSLTANTTKTISPGGQVYYPHTLVNSGNGVDTFALASTNSGTFGFTSVAFYADANGDGVPDNAVPITSTGALAMGATFRFVAAAIVPTTAVSGNTNTLAITATSGFNSGNAAAVTDTTTITGQAVIAVTQSLDLTQGPSPSAGRTITINYTNTGNTSASAVVLSEVIPSGMTYLAGSARWSVSGSTVLTDADATDNQSGIVYDYGATVGGRVTAVIANVAPGSSGTLSFKVDINSGLPAGANPPTAATVRYGYYDGATTIAANNANTVQYTVLSNAAVSLTGATVASTVQGGTVDFLDTVTNNGNSTDTFDLTTLNSNFPAGTTFQLFQSNGVTPLLDSNGNQTPDSGPLAAGASLNFIVRAFLPPGASGGPYTVQAKATSGTDTTKTATALNTLTAVAGSTMDLTNDSATVGAPGYGPGYAVGAEPTPVQTLSVNPGGTVRFTLVAANTSNVADTYTLQASTDNSFASNTLPTGWTVVFKNALGQVVDNTGVINGGANKTVYADVTVPAGALAATTQLYFRTVSPTTGATDRLHDAVTVNLVRSLTLTPNQVGQTTAGGTAVYPHTLVNNSNTLEGDGVASTINLTVANSGSGFTSVVYWDKNNNGILDPSDPVVTNTAQLTGGSNGANTTAGLATGASVRLFVKVTAPASATSGAGDVATLTASVSGTIGAVAAPAAVAVTDTTSVITSQVTLLIMQAIDTACDGTADVAYAVTPISGAAPNTCVRYEVTATNSGPVTVTSVAVSVPTPAYTTYTITVPASSTLGTVAAPADGATGLIQTTIASLTPGQLVVIRFGVRITP